MTAEVPTQTKSTLKELQDQAETELMVGAIAELLFVILPLLVLAIVFSFRGHAANILTSPEWSFGAAVVFGQSIVRLVRTIAEGKGFKPERMGLFSAILLVLGLVPSLVVLSLFLVNQPNEPGIGLVIAQFVLFVLSIFSYILCAILAAQDIAEQRLAIEKARQGIRSNAA